MVGIPAKYRNRNMFRRMLLVVSLCVFIYSAGMLAYEFIDDYRSKKTYEEISKIYNPIPLQKEENAGDKAASITQEQTDSELLSRVEDGKKAEEAGLKISAEERLEKEEEARLKKESEERMAAFKSIQKINKDTVGYIFINNTKINYPVVQGKDNIYYLTHDIRKRSSQHGAIFMDAGNNVISEKDIPGQNIVLYGHYMKDGSMFAGLKSFRYKSFFQDNPIIEFDILGEKYQWQIFSEYIAEGGFNYRQTSFKSAVEFNDFIKNIRCKSYHYRKVDVTSKDTILTLSTCAYDFVDARLVIHAKLIN